MRAVPIALALLVAAGPAQAAPREAARPSPADAARALQEPLVQDAAAAMIVRLADIILDTHVGPVAALVDPRERVRATDTLRDLERRDDPEFDAHLRRDTRRAVGAAASVAGGAAAQADELKRTTARLDEALAPLLGALRPRD